MYQSHFSVFCSFLSICGLPSFALSFLFLLLLQNYQYAFSFLSSTVSTLLFSYFFFPKNNKPHLLTTASILIGGRQSKYAVPAFEVFDIETRSWTKFPNIPNKRAYSRYVLNDGSIYSLGGLRQGGTYRRPKFTKTVDLFDMEQGKKLFLQSYYIAAQCQKPQ